MSKKQIRNLYRIIIAASLFAVLFILDKLFDFPSLFPSPYGFILSFILYFSVYVLIGYDVIYKAFKNIFSGQVFDECFLMMIATFGAFALAIFRGIKGLEIEGFDEACAVLIFYQVGEFFQAYAVNKSRKSIVSLMDIRPDTANKLVNDEVCVVDPSEVSVGDLIVVNPGEKVPVDGYVVEGESYIDTKSLTGEAKLRKVSQGQSLISGAINVDSKLVMKVEKVFYDSTVNKILELVENAESKKAKIENFISRFARIYTPLVVVMALLIAIVPSLFFKNWDVWIYRSLSFLVVSCPCALVISIPLSFFASIGLASKNGILIKGAQYIEQFNNVTVMAFDKTGTLTKGNFEVIDIRPRENAEEILRLAALAEENLSHPIAKSICNKYGKITHNSFVSTIIMGKGVKAVCNDEVILCGNAKLFEQFNLEVLEVKDTGSVVHVGYNNKYLGYILISDSIKEESYDLIKYLKNNKIHTVMMTGDNKDVALSVGKKLQIDEVHYSLLPNDKYELLESLKKDNNVVCYIGDGINDAPSLMLSDIGISMGGVGSDAAIEASDIVLMEDKIDKVITIKQIAKKTMKIVSENIIMALGIKLIILVLSALGITNMWIAIFGDVGVALLAILNAFRLHYNINSIKKS